MASNELKITRVYDAPVKLVWDAWTDPVKAAHWWGPRGFTITTKSKDLCPGGRWVYTMHGPDGTDWPNSTLYHEVEPFKKLAYDHGSDGTSSPLFRVQVTFKETKGKTTMEMTMIWKDAETATQMKKFIKQASGNATWDRLAEYLNDKDIFVINRSFEAPQAVVFKMFTDPERFSKWLPPTGSTMKFIKQGLKVGKETFYSMTDSQNNTMYGKMKYLEISPTDRLVYTQQFADKDGHTSRPPFAPTWPETMLTTVTFTEEGADQTRVTVVWEIFDEAKQIERDTFHAAKAGMTMGWTGSFDKLEVALENGLMFS